MTDRVPGDPPPSTPAATSATSEPVPLGQRFFDNVFLLMGLGLVIMFALYTGWGMWEILTLPKATLP